MQGTVRVAAFEKPVLISGRENMNRSVDGDIVAVEIFPETQWKVAEDEVVEEDGKPSFESSVRALLKQPPVVNKNDDAETDEKEGQRTPSAEHKQSAQPREQKEKEPTGRVVGVIKRNWRA
jgi:exosome complex exonuclease DIS3/RRP44